MYTRALAVTARSGRLRFGSAAPTTRFVKVLVYARPQARERAPADNTLSAPVASTRLSDSFLTSAPPQTTLCQLQLPPRDYLPHFFARIIFLNSSISISPSL